MAIVIDSSAAISVMLNETIPGDVYRAISRAMYTEVIVPSIWALEMSNVMTMLVRKGRLTISQRDSELRNPGLLPIELDNTDTEVAWTTIVDLADRHLLTCYEAAYVELAIRRQLPLASLDTAMTRAARAEGVEVIGIAV